MADICPVCGETFGRERRGRPRIYCSTTCRVRAFRKRQPATVTITISRATAEGVVHDLPEASADFAFGRVALACRAALEGER